MFKNRILLTCALLVPLLGLWIYQTGVPKAKDHECYQTMVENKQVASSLSKAPTNQERKQVRKDIWFSQDGTSRLHYQITSKDSLLTLTPAGNRFEVVESLKGISCWMQDKLVRDEKKDTLSQQARYFEADSGIYRHTTQEFTAEGISLSLFKLAGHNLPVKPVKQSDAILRGVAEGISFYFGGKTPKFQAKEFQAKMVKE
ncbi:MAG: hypothetical protein P0S96_01810 [Simkaniaceae bacterium]|nr:hypothetical protein [Candidatus Sacchlamyda saccharinae]